MSKAKEYLPFENFVVRTPLMPFNQLEETLEKMKSRARNFLTYLKVTYPDKKVLAVGHGIINKAIQSVYFNKPMSEIPKMGNAEVRILML